MLKVAYHIPDEGGCTYYRVLNPMLACRRNQALGAKGIAKNDDMVMSASALTECDVFLLSRLSDDILIDVVAGLQNRGKKVIIDYDDDLFSVSPLSPFYAELGTEEVKTVINGKEVYLWRDGENTNDSPGAKAFNIKENTDRLAAIRRICGAVDMITVTTPELADTYSQYNKHVRVLPNCVDLRVWGRPRFAPRPDGNVRIGWFGGSSHYEDWAMVAPAVHKILKDYPYAKLVIMGSKFDGTLKGIDPGQIEYHGWVHTQAYPYAAQLLDLDMGIIPLKDTVFNRNKSAIKWIEMGAMGVPAVTSCIPPYSTVMDIVPDNGVFIDGEDPAVWYEGISQLIENRSLREKIGENAQRTVAENFDINREYTRWSNLYKEAFTWLPRQHQLSQVS